MFLRMCLLFSGKIGNKLNKLRNVLNIVSVVQKGEFVIQYILMSNKDNRKLKYGFMIEIIMFC